MKTLLVARHAKSSWSEANLSDFDRPLNKRGLRDAPRMGRFLRDQRIQPEYLVASPAKRAWTTAQLIAAEFDIADFNIHAEPNLYGAGVADTMHIVQSFADQWSTAMIFGHNPTTTSFVNWLTDADIDNVPTCGVANIALPTNSWARLGEVKAELVAFYVPKELPD